MPTGRDRCDLDFAVRPPWRQENHAPDRRASQTAPALPSGDLLQQWRAPLWVSFGTALSSFIYEIGWVRMLSLVLGSATHSFELMLSAFILGLALGALWIRRRIDRDTAPLRTLGIVQWTAMGPRWRSRRSRSTAPPLVGWRCYSGRSSRRRAPGTTAFSLSKPRADARHHAPRHVLRWDDASAHYEGALCDRRR